MAFKGAIIDLDGTVYRGGSLIEGSAAGVQALREAGVRCLFFSNNPTKPPARVAQFLRERGLDVPENRVLTSGAVTASYIGAEHADATLLVIGEDSVANQLAAFEQTTDPAAADVLVAAIDRDFTYDRLTTALHALDEETVFLGTDPDRTIPRADGLQVPGSGAIIGAIEATAEREPDRILGKPSSTAIETAVAQLGYPAEECLVVGDRLDTDIAMGESAGMTTALVLSGAHSRGDIERLGISPDHVLASLAGVSELL